jgi:hypothetical protein
MAYLINRNPSGRLLCLHGLLQYVAHHWGDGPYEIRNFKFDAQRVPNIHEFSPCATTSYGFQSCIYLDNPSSLAGCGLVNSVIEDTQKSKSASDIFNALDGLGFITRNDNKAVITPLGREFISAERDSLQWEVIARKGVQNYGPFVGLTYLASQFGKDAKWRRNQVNLGFAETGEEVEFNNERVILSTGSQNDTVTRSRSSIIAWGVATGYFIPSVSKIDKIGLPSQVSNYEYLMSSKLADGFINSELVYKNLTNVVGRPLSYNQLVKSIKSLRENGQEAQRNASLHWEQIIKNRRLAVAFTLNTSAVIGKPLVFDKFVEELSKLPNFVVAKDQLWDIMATELKNAFVIGTPYEVMHDGRLQGLRQVDLDVLCFGATESILDQLRELVTKSSLFEG